MDEVGGDGERERERDRDRERERRRMKMGLERRSETKGVGDEMKKKG